MCDAAAAGVAAPGAGLGCLPRYQVQGLLDSGELVWYDRARAVASSTRVIARMTPPAVCWQMVAGNALANSAIFTIYHTETV